MTLTTLHLIGSKRLGGAENWFFRFTSALKEYGIEVYRGVRTKSDLETHNPDNIYSFSLPFYTVWDPISKLSISNLIKKLKPHIVQTYMSRATRLTKIKSGDCLHIARLGGYYGLKSFRSAHAWVGNTKGICDYLIQNGFPKDRVFYITNFVDIPDPSPENKKKEILQKLNIPEDSFIILTPARFVPVKGHTTLLKGISHLIRDKDIKENIRVILAGDGPLFKKLKSCANSLGIDEYLVWPGWQKDISLYYELSDLIVFPSREEEALGNVILEAWSHKKPVVCTKFRGAREITEDLLDVIQCDCDDEKGLYGSIKKAVLDNDLRKYISENGYRKILKKYTKHKIVNQYIELYNFLLK